MSTMTGNAAECQALTANYQGNYSGEDPTTYTRTNCTMGAMGLKP